MEDDSKNKTTTLPVAKKNSIFHRKLIIGLGFVIASIIPFAPKIIVGIGAVSGVVTLCQVDNFSSASSILKTFCKAMASQTPPVAPDADGLYTAAFFGNWVGRWEKKGTFVFQVNKITYGVGDERNKFDIDYSYQNPDGNNDIETEKLSCKSVNEKKIFCPPFISVEYNDRDDTLHVESIKDSFDTAHLSRFKNEDAADNK